MTTWKSAEIHIEGNQIHYHRTGGEKPPLILLHGFSDNGLCWIRAAQALEKNYDLIMPDAHGHGLSYRVTPGQPLNLVSDVAGLIQALNLEKPALLGHSMGAATAASVAATYPELVGVALLEDPPWFEKIPQAGGEEDSEESAHPWQWLLDLWEKPEAEIAAEGRRAHSPAWAEIEFDPWAASKLQLDRNIFQSMAHPAPWTEVVPGIKCPTLLITAEPELGGLVNPQTAQQIANGWPLVQVVQIKGAGHNIRREQFDAYMETVTKFLREHYE